MTRRCLMLAGWAATLAFGQTTQGLMSGRMVDALTGKPLAGAAFECDGSSSDSYRQALTDETGHFVVPLISPGTYRVRASAENYQAQEIYGLEVRVAGEAEFSFRLHPLKDVWQAGKSGSVFFPENQTVVNFYGPDLDTSRSISVPVFKVARGALETAVSQVVDPVQIEELPLAGRDIYTTLILQPGVTADTASSGGLGLSVDGQRPTSSNFLLDGVENNNYLITGPLVTAAPEATQEYRISSNVFSAEYGGTGGVLADAITRAGGTQWHGIGYFYLKNAALNANDFQRNSGGLARPPLHEQQPGLQAGGPIRRGGLFTSTAFEYLRSRSYGDPVSILLPATGFLNLLANSPGDPNAVRALNFLKSYAWAVPVSALPDAKVAYSLPSFVNRALLLERLDYAPARGRHHVMARVASSSLERPQFIWSPYQGFSSPLVQNTVSLMGAVTSSVSPHRVNEARLSWSSDDLSWDRAHPEVPTLTTLNGDLLPGSLSSYAYRNRSRGFEVSDQFVWSSGNHLLKFGGGVLLRDIYGYLTYGRDGELDFESLLQFAASTPYGFSTAVDRGALPNLQAPSFDREYSDNQFRAFAQDTFRVMPRLTLNYGVRYENSGSPRNTGAAKDLLVEPAAGVAGLVGAALVPDSRNQSIYSPDNRDWAARLGASYALTPDSHTLLSAGYGMFYERAYDNLWQNVRNNNVALPEFYFTGQTVNYTAAAAQLLPQFSGGPVDASIPNLTWIAHDLRNGYVQSAFLGLRQQFTERLTLEINGLETAGRRLISTDILNRDSSVPSWPEVSYRANQGSSDYNALTALLAYRASRMHFQAAYTWSHSLDNQSSPLAGDFFNLYFTGLTATAGYQPVAAFSIAGDSRFDRGNSDFDQRQNLVLMSTTELPGPGSTSKALSPLRDWRISTIASFRTGFPYSVYTENGSDGIINARGDLLNPSQEFTNQPAPGGRMLLTRGAFADPAGFVGNLGRNAISGPGLYNIDFSIGRTIPVHLHGDTGRLQLRADLFNVLNHANLGNPDSTVGSGFGIALYGRKPAQTGFPGLVPLTEIPRQIQLMLRVEW